MFNERDFFYCYSTNLFKYLKVEKEINYICCGLHEKTLRKFWQFVRTKKLEQALKEYGTRGKELKIKI